ncbi:MAG: cytochrome c peroxidase [Phaeodactylibacter sp.]|uniref:cytochrome-c peroxidase n=1 Tax=Phaeodactylibacter sp. TaxID=1940289 RepID=UPI0032ED4451
MNRFFGHITGAILLFALSNGCTQGTTADTAPAPLHGPEHFVQLVDYPENPYHPEKAALGQMLFFDPVLSKDSTLSCGSCHLPERAFTDGKAIAVGIENRKGTRNAPSLVNLAWVTTGLFWDGRSPTLEAQAVHPVINPNELGSDWPTVLQRLRAHPDYPRLFERAFGGPLEQEQVVNALAHFQRSLMSSESKYDSIMREEAAYTVLELRGKHIFFDSSEELPDGECGHCHTPPLFTDQTYMNNGVQEEQAPYTYTDPGRGAVTGAKYDNGRFRVPSLRNITLTAPYMHDGRFSTLQEVIEHYNSGGHPGPNVDPKIRKLHLSDEDKLALIAFLGTLTDTSFVRKLSDQKALLQ